jgi:hypothetical protein
MIEVLSAIFALERVCCLSARLAQGVLPRVLDLLGGMSMDLQPKVRLVSTSP